VKLPIVSCIDIAKEVIPGPWRVPLTCSIVGAVPCPIVEVIHLMLSMVPETIDTLNVAAQLMFPESVICAVRFIPAGAQSPLQPLKVEPDAGTAVRETIAPVEKDATHAEPQLIPAGEDVTVPVPVPLFVTLSAYPPHPEGFTHVNVAATALSLFIVTTQVPDPLQSPDHAEKE